MRSEYRRGRCREPAVDRRAARRPVAPCSSAPRRAHAAADGAQRGGPRSARTTPAGQAEAVQDHAVRGGRRFHGGPCRQRGAGGSAARVIGASSATVRQCPCRQYGQARGSCPFTRAMNSSAGSVTARLPPVRLSRARRRTGPRSQMRMRSLEIATGGCSALPPL